MFGKNKRAVVFKCTVDGGASLFIEYEAKTLLVTSVFWENNTAGTFTVTVKGPTTGGSVIRGPHTGSGSMEVSQFGVHLDKVNGNPVVPFGWSFSLSFSQG